MNTKAVAVDLDGTLAYYESWQGIDFIGGIMPGAKRFMNALHELGFHIIIHSTRLSPTINANYSLDELKAPIEKWLSENGIPYDEIWTYPGKPLAIAYIDDRAIQCKPMLQNGFDTREYERVLEQLAVCVYKEIK